jgi:RNA-binding protein YhbY
MTNQFPSKFQIGKGGLTQGVIESLQNNFKRKRQVRVTVLKSFCRNKEEMKALTQKIEEALPFQVKSRIIGYTIVLLKQSQKTKK